ncbi:MAG: hypothetical protein JWM80_6462 [Cyanobacteria bacterium RYN_339]|nr:hypothetical protein [Cyanobacteria bacterium RYN_339]
MTDAADDTSLPISARYAAMASKSAGQAEIALRRVHTATGEEDPRAAKRARREAAEWCDTAKLDAMRAHGALAAESGVFDAVHGAADEAVKRATAARDGAAAAYREMKAEG